MGGRKYREKPSVGCAVSAHISIVYIVPGITNLLQ